MARKLHQFPRTTANVRIDYKAPYFLPCLMSTTQQIPVARVQKPWQRPDRSNPNANEVDVELQLLADWLDSVFHIPGTKIRFGLDAILGLLPGFGDTLSSIISLYILHASHRYGVPRMTMARMGLNTAIDWIIGSIPFAGDVFDVYWKANQRNVALLRRHLRHTPAERQKASRADTIFVVGMIAVLIAVLIGSITLTVLAVKWLFGLVF